MDSAKIGLYLGLNTQIDRKLYGIKEDNDVVYTTVSGVDIEALIYYLENKYPIPQNPKEKNINETNLFYWLKGSMSDMIKHDYIIGQTENLVHYREINPEATYYFAMVNGKLLVYNNYIQYWDDFEKIRDMYIFKNQIRQFHTVSKKKRTWEIENEVPTLRRPELD